MRKLTALASVAALIATPAIAAPVANPASSLSVAKARVGTPSAKKSNLAGGGAIAAALLAAGVVAIGVVAVVNDSDDSDSN